MLRTVAPTLLLLACGLALAGCRASSDGAASGTADALVPALNSFTEELLAKVETAGDKKAGVAAAQALLDARKTELSGRVASLKRDAGSKAKLLEAEVDNTDRVHRLQLKYAEEAARDPEFRARLERLIADYDSLYGGH